MKGVILVLSITGFLHAQQGSLEGTAVNAATREPLSNVHVRLVAAGLNGINAAYGAMSDRTGHFSIATIRPGTYVLMPDRAGFLYVQAKGGARIPNLTIKPGEAVTGYQLEMTPRAVISGRVVDESGDPVQGAQVQTISVKPGNVPITTQNQYQATDDRGEFRLNAAPGKYYLEATISSRFGEQERPEIRSDGTSEAIYVATFYPSSARKERGTAVEAAAGKEVSGIEIRLVRQQQGLSISGVVSGAPDGQWRGYVILQSGENAQRIRSRHSTGVGPDGKFRFGGLQPGFYRAMAQYNVDNTHMASRTMEWQLENSDVANVELVLSPGLELTGSVKVEGEAAGTAAPKRKVTLEPAMGSMAGNIGPPGGDVDGSGAFRIANLMPGKYRVRVEPPAENSYIKALEMDGVAAANDILDLSQTARGASVKVTLSPNAAQVSGRVLDNTGENPTGIQVVVFLARNPEEVTLAGNGVEHPAQDGKYTIKGVAPGKYRLFALDALQIYAADVLDDDPNILKKLYERGEEIEFKEGDRITKDLKVLAMEEANAKAKQ